MVVLGVLGPVELRASDGTPVRLNSARQRRLLAALALRRSGPVTVDALAELVWGDDLPADPAAAVQTNVARLRRQLPDGVRIETEPTGYRLRADPGALDADVFGDLLDRAAASVESQHRLVHLDAALALWRGQPYEELDRDDVVAEQARLSEMRGNAVEALADALLQTGRPDDAIAVLEAHVTAEPLRERPVATLVRALATTGRQADALRACARLRETLREELGLDPSPELQELEAAVLRQDFVAAQERILPHAPGRGPRRSVLLPVSSFVGRDRDLDAVTALLDGCRVVTLCGPGGVGKSRLALHVAAGVADRYSDGVAVVELGTLLSGGDVAPALAAAVRISGQAGESLEDRLAEVLSVRRLLLLLDDCEHVAEAVAPLVERLVRTGPRLDVLATSREPLRVDGEHVHLVRPLERAAAVALLADRAAALAADLDPDALGKVVARLDGLPLAVELAAARLSALGGAGLAAALDEPFEVLTGGRRGARHRSLLDVVEWSYRSLDDDQRRLFDRMSIFNGTVDAAAVVDVCGTSTVALADLVERSLVTVDGGAGTGPRYGMLDTLRTYGRRQLARTGSGERLRDVHATWAGRTGSDLLRALDTADAPSAVARFDALLPDLRAGFERLVRSRRLDELDDLGVLLGMQAFHRLRDDLVRMVDDAVDALWDEVHPALAHLLGWSAQTKWQRGALDDSQRLADRGIAVAETLGDPQAARDCHSARSNVALFRADLDTAAVETDRAVALADAEPASVRASYVRLDQGLLAAYKDDHGRSVVIAEEYQALADASGSPLWLAWAAYLRGENLAERDPLAARPHLERAIAHAAQVDASFIVGVARHTLLTSRARVIDHAAPVTEFDPLLDHWHRAGAWTQLWVAIRALVERLSVAGRHEDVVRLIAASEASTRAAPPFGPDAERLVRASARAAAVLGDRVTDLVAEGRALADEGAVALARRITGA